MPDMPCWTGLDDAHVYLVSQTWASSAGGLTDGGHFPLRLEHGEENEHMAALGLEHPQGWVVTYGAIQGSALTTSQSTFPAEAHINPAGV